MSAEQPRATSEALPRAVPSPAGGSPPPPSGRTIAWREVRCRGCNALLLKHDAVGRLQIVCPRSRCRVMTEAVIE